MEVGKCSNQLVKSSKRNMSFIDNWSPIFGPYSFINISCGKEQMDDVEYSRKNMVEVAVVTRIVHNLYKAWKKGLRQPLSVTITSPYTAQLVEIKDRLGQGYRSYDEFKVKVIGIDELKGDKVDIIVLSTVRSNSDGSIGLLSDHKRVNLVLTSARHSLWILGNERALSRSDSAVWKLIIRDAKDQKCFFNVEEDEDLAQFVIDVKKELDQLDDLLDADSFLFRNAKWKVLFSDNFRKSFQKMKSSQMKKLVINMLLKLANGWRPKRRNVNITCCKSEQILKQFKVKDLHVLCSIDIVKEYWYIQVLKVWDVLPLVDIPKMVKHLDNVFLTYSADVRNRCKEKCIVGDLEIPMNWETSHDIVCYKKHNYIQEGIELVAEASDNRRSIKKDFKMSDSLQLMKFYSLSSGMVNHLLSDCIGTELELPFELSSQEMEVVHFDKTSFILGRSGTGKTTVLIRKLFQRQQLHHITSEGFHELDACISKDERTEDGERVKESEQTSLRQIFVTLNPRLCLAVKQQVAGLKRFACGKLAKDSTSVPLDDINGISHFEDDISDSFEGLPPKLYPLVITFHKFLIMLDGTVGSSFFNRFPEARVHFCGKIRDTKLMALRTFIRMKEVNFKKFNLSYWPRFNKKLTKDLKPSTVFTEIMSHIKGGRQALEFHDGKLGHQDYILQSRCRVSRLNSQEREKIYKIFLDYEKKKTVNGEYDLADLVIDVHRRLREENYDAIIKFDFVYIDEVQDLTMGQIALFKYICRNVYDGFVFSGDTAQTIAKGVDFRFEDIRHLFYKEFIMKFRGDKIYGRGEKSLISKLFHLSKNFRTHSGILNLAQSVVNLVYYFFPVSIDVLSPETSLITGETPLLLQSLNDKTTFASILGDARACAKNLVGFGADQVVLVRDDNAKNEIRKSVGKHALILTISQCKGLEFQDVLLYNFLSSSPIRNEWKVIYQYMKDKHILGLESTISFPSFDEAKHSLLCTELKQLYVAITRTRRRLWIYEDSDGLSHPIHDYWQKLQIVNVQILDHSFVKKIQVSSSKEEWKSRGIKLFSEQEYETAKFCFQRAGETFLEQWAEAAGLRSAAWSTSNSNFDMAEMFLKKAAKIFNSIGKLEEAAQCFYESKEYEMAGLIYLENYGDSKLLEAGECFTRAGSYKRAASAYAKGNIFSSCLDSCIQGKLFDEGFSYIGQWKEHATLNNYMEREKDKIETTEMKLLKGAAHNYKRLGDKISMMNCVKAFHSKDSMRIFLQTEGFVEELLQLESEWGNFFDAAKIARKIGETLREAELLEKLGHFKEASQLIMFHVFANSIWVPGSRGWPLKHFPEKEILDKAKTLASNVSPDFFELVCTEENVLSDKKAALPVLKQLLSDSKRHQSVAGEILCAWKILDFHFSVSRSEYMWQDNLVTDLKMQAESVLLQNEVSIETLVFFWNNWKEKIGKIFEYLWHLQNDNAYGNFCLNYLAVRVTKCFGNKKAMYLLLKPDANWVKEISERHLHQEGKLVFCKDEHFSHAARCYWSSEILSVGTKVFESLKAFYEYSNENALPLHCQTISLIHMHRVAKSLGMNHGKVPHHHLEVSTNSFVGTVFPLDWLKPLTLYMTNLRETEDFKNILEDIVCKTINSNSHLTYQEIGNVVTMIIGGSSTLSDKTYKKISQRFDSDPFWKSCIEYFGNVRSEVMHLSSPSDSFDPLMQVSLVQKFHKALEHTYYADSLGESDYISPSCFIYLVERLLVLVFYFKGCFVSIKSSFLEWLINQKWNENAIYNYEDDWQQMFIGTIDFIGAIVAELLYNECDVITWIENSKLSSVCHPQDEITSQLPQEFFNIIQKLKSGNLDDNVCVLAEALQKVGNPLVIVRSSGKCCGGSETQDAIFVDLEVPQGREELISIMFK